ncbi:MFS transporter [Collinsella sp. zg1085]|uniref:MFS transporter n=1 Tax=Collinsella sp. zg1085 TaxID=2844380 RepID=UPI001C0AC61A|nr:MFS transporter [Collinsella sp. zg1085]QWT17178.1 MFS transporter [Collinsella sp. zg1085]
MSSQVQASSAGKPRFHYAYIIVLTGIIMTGVPCALVYSCAGIFFTPVSAAFGVSKAAFSLYFSIANIAMMLSLPFAGRLMSHGNIRVVLSVACALCGVGLIVFSQLQELWQFYVVSAFIGAGVAPLLYLAVPTLINAWCAERVGFFVGLCMAFTGIGGVVFNPLGSALIATGPEGWRLAYLVFGLIICIGALPLIACLVRARPEELGLNRLGEAPAAARASEQTSAGSSTSQSSEDAPAPDSHSSLYKSPAFLALACFCGLITLNQTVYQFLPSYTSFLADGGVGAAAGVSGIVAAACMAGQAFGKVALGGLSDRSIVGSLSLGIGAGMVGVLIMMLAPELPFALLGGSLLFGLVYSCTTVQTPLLTRSVFGGASYTDVYARISMVGSLMGAVAAVFWAWICELPHGYIWMFVLSLVVMAACWVLGVYALRRRVHTA